MKGEDSSEFIFVIFYTIIVISVLILNYVLNVYLLWDFSNDKKGRAEKDTSVSFFIDSMYYALNFEPQVYVLSLPRPVY